VKLSLLSVLLECCGNLSAIDREDYWGAAQRNFMGKPNMADNPCVGRWTYRSLFNDPDAAAPFDKLKFGVGTKSLT
jgi:hypothetical protein